jgi:hypothetical protein
MHSSISAASITNPTSQRKCLHLISRIFYLCEVAYDLEVAEVEAGVPLLEIRSMESLVVVLGIAKISLFN